MTPSSRRAPKEPVDTTDDPEIEAKWQALVQAVVDAKAAAEKKRQAWHEACLVEAARPEDEAAHRAVVAAKADYEAAKDAVVAAQERMKAGDL